MTTRQISPIDLDEDTLVTPDGLATITGAILIAPATGTITVETDRGPLDLPLNEDVTILVAA